MTLVCVYVPLPGIRPGFPYTGLRAGMFVAEISRRQLSGYGAAQVVPILV
jgi:hypothetical protein